MKPVRKIIHWTYYQGKFIGADYTGYAVAEILLPSIKNKFNVK